MKQGDLIWAKKEDVTFSCNDEFICGVVLRQVNFKDHRLKAQRDVFSILWQDGKVRSEWGCNLVLTERL